MDLRQYASALAIAAACYAPSAFAQSSEPSEGSGEIVVTAQRRAQAIQDVSASVSAFSAERLETAQVNNIEDLQMVAPSIFLGNDFNMAKLFIRGIGANTSTTGSETGVALHVDGAFVARAEAQLASIFDLERVEVLRGPQGTLYGRNAVGGSVNLITAKPTHEWDGYFRGSVGSFGTMNGEAAISGPITEHILGRVAWASQTHDGFGENPVTGGDIDDLNRHMVRGHLLFEFTENFDMMFTGEYYDQEDASRAVKFRRETYPGLVRLAALGIGGYASDPRDLASEIDAETETEVVAGTVTTNFQATDALKFTNITSWRRIEGFITQDLDVSAVVNGITHVPPTNSTIQRRDIESEQFSSELQLTYESESVDLVLGAFYFTEQQRPVDTVGLGAVLGEPFTLARMAAPTVVQVDGVAVAPSPISPDLAFALCNNAEHLGGANPATTPPKRVCIKSDLQSDAWAIFGQATINLGMISSALEQFSIKLGGRYSDEEVFASNASMIFAAAAPAGPILIGTPEGSANTKQWEAFTPEIGVEWRPTDDLLFYYTYSEGFKAGAGENAAPGALTGFVSVIVDPEEVEAHEVGMKSTLFDGRVRLNAAAFSYELAGQQINKTLSGGPAGFQTVFENAAQTEGDGVELELFAAPTDSFRVSGALAWLDSRYVEFDTVDPLDPRNIPGGSCALDPPGTCPIDGDPITPGFQGTPIPLAGNRTRNSPEWSANFHAELDFPGFGDGLFTAMTDVTYRDDIYFTEFQRLLEGQPAYTLWDANLRYESGGNHFTANLWVKNITDELVAASTFALATARTIGVTYLPPRTFGLTLGYRY